VNLWLWNCAIVRWEKKWVSEWVCVWWERERNGFNSCTLTHVTHTHKHIHIRTYSQTHSHISHTRPTHLHRAHTHTRHRKDILNKWNEVKNEENIEINNKRIMLKCTIWCRSFIVAFHSKNKFRRFSNVRWPRLSFLRYASHSNKWNTSINTKHIQTQHFRHILTLTFKYDFFFLF